MSLRVRDATAQDRPAILRLNAASVAELSPLDEQRLDYILALAHRCLVVAEQDDADEVLGFAIAIAPGGDYDSANYRWFAQRLGSFLYLDRIAVASQSRRRGIGARLYEAMEAAATPFGRMVCDVNIQPRNDASLAFHAARGYREVGQLQHGSSKTVALMCKQLAAA